MRFALRIWFAGSFQCRLATDGDRTDDKPMDYYGQYETVQRNGWTFAYKEQPFDRIIRLSNPVDLRNGLIDPWQDAKVTRVQVIESSGFAAQLWMTSTAKWDDVKGDLLVGRQVSFGKIAKFETLNRTPGEDDITNFEFSIAGALAARPGLSRFSGIPPATKNGLGLIHHPWKREYETTKPGLVDAANMDPWRKQYIFDEEHGNMQGLSTKFGMIDPLETSLDHVMLTSNNGVLANQDDLSEMDWNLELAMFRFDGDTLTGQCKGVVTAAAPRMSLPLVFQPLRGQPPGSQDDRGAAIP